MQKEQQTVGTTNSVVPAAAVAAVADVADQQPCWPAAQAKRPVQKWRTPQARWRSSCQTKKLTALQKGLQLGPPGEKKVCQRGMASPCRPHTHLLLYGQCICDEKGAKEASPR